MPVPEVKLHFWLVTATDCVLQSPYHRLLVLVPVSLSVHVAVKLSSYSLTAVS